MSHVLYKTWVYGSVRAGFTKPKVKVEASSSFPVWSEPDFNSNLYHRFMYHSIIIMTNGGRWFVKDLAEMGGGRSEPWHSEIRDAQPLGDSRSGPPRLQFNVANLLLLPTSWSLCVCDAARARDWVQDLWDSPAPSVQDAVCCTQCSSSSVKSMQGLTKEEILLLLFPPLPSSSTQRQQHPARKCRQTWN